LPSRTDPQISTTERARAWLYANCANCHRPDSNLVHDLDLRFATPLADTGICDVPPNHGDLGIADARLIAPGDPSRSVLLARVRSLDVNKMPPRSGFTYDPDGAALLEDWIGSLTSCR
jgi:hypothetical protein